MEMHLFGLCGPNQHVIGHKMSYMERNLEFKMGHHRPYNNLLKCMIKKQEHQEVAYSFSKNPPGTPQNSLFHTAGSSSQTQETPWIPTSKLRVVQ